MPNINDFASNRRVTNSKHDLEECLTTGEIREKTEDDETKEGRGMALGITLAIAAIIGIIYGIINKNKFLGIVSVIVLIMIVAVWIYFYNNPY